MPSSGDLEMFLDEVESAMMRLSAKDPKRLETSLHFLKGCAWNLGFAAFGGLCDEEERRRRRPCRRGRHRRAADLLFRIEEGDDARAGRRAAGRFPGRGSVAVSDQNSARTGSRVMSR